jgi:uncharacterized damage-inducible protein DinB
MHSPDAVGQLLAYDRWSNERMLEALSQVAAPDDELLAIAAHIFAAIERWACRIEGVPPQHDLDWGPRPLTAIRTLAADAQGHLAATVEGLSEDALHAPFESRNAAGQVFEQRVGEVLLHVALHGAEHRGQCWLLIGQQGGPTDAPEVAWYRLGRGEGEA